MTRKARGLRIHATDAEKALWRILRSGRIKGLAFRRQHPLGDYVLDFYCPAIRMAIEVDGGQHNQAPGREHDQTRTQWLRSKGIIVLRFWNNDVLANIEGVATEIARVGGALRAGLTPTLTLPLSGGGNKRSIDIVFGEVDR
jgi:very-short-patch-repair endonuclease